MRKCEICKKEYSKPPKYTYAKWAISRFCSANCRSKYVSYAMRGNQIAKGKIGFKGPHTAKSRALISHAKTLNPTKYWLGKKRSPDTLLKMSASARTKTGVNASHYYHDRSLLKVSDRQSGHRYRIWRESVLSKDGRQCMQIDSTCEGKLEAHHLLPWKEFSAFRYDTENGITLCHKHHPRGKIAEEFFLANLLRSKTITLTASG